MKNKYKVAKDQWAKWSPRRRAVFNKLFQAMVADQDSFMHIQCPVVLGKEFWHTTAWNAAWMAGKYAEEEP